MPNAGSHRALISGTEIFENNILPVAHEQSVVKIAAFQISNASFKHKSSSVIQ